MLTFARAKRFLTFAALGLAGLTLTGCYDVADIPKHLRPLSASTKKLIAKYKMAETGPILIRIFKEESLLEVWKQQASGRYALLKTYDICKWSGALGPKRKEGDRQAPEGFYTITPAQMNPNSSYHLSFDIGFPNAYDQAHGSTGTHLMVHGACSSAGCYAMKDEQIQEIYTLARLAFQGGQRSFQVQAFPFRMTPQNMAKHRREENYAFWKMMKEGYDHFEVTGVPPKIGVCSKRYVFNAEPMAGVKFSPTSECPEMSVPESVRIAVTDKEAKDNAKEEIIAAKIESASGAPAGSKAATQMGIAAIPTAEVDKVAVAAAVERTASETEPATTAAFPALPDSVGPNTSAPLVQASATMPQPAPERGDTANAEPQTPATAYAPKSEPDSESGFFGRLIKKVW